MLQTRECPASLTRRSVPSRCLKSGSAWRDWIMQSLNGDKGCDHNEVFAQNLRPHRSSLLDH